MNLGTFGGKGGGILPLVLSRIEVERGLEVPFEDLNMTLQTNN